MDLVEASGQTPTIAVERTPTQPGMSGPTVPRHDPVVQRKAKGWQALIILRDRWETLELVAEVVAEEPDQATQERGRIGRYEAGPVQTSDEPTCDGERVGPRCRSLQDRDRISRQERPARRATRSSALEQGEPGQVPEGLGDIDRAPHGDTVRESTQTQ